MRYQEHIKILQKEYFKKFFEIKSKYPDKKGKEIWELTEQAYDFNMYSNYNVFRTSLSQYQKKQRQCKK
jgi:hypothetical protein